MNKLYREKVRILRAAAHHHQPSQLGTPMEKMMAVYIIVRSGKWNSSAVMLQHHVYEMFTMTVKQVKVQSAAMADGKWEKRQPEKR